MGERHRKLQKTTRDDIDQGPEQPEPPPKRLATAECYRGVVGAISSTAGSSFDTPQALFRNTSPTARILTMNSSMLINLRLIRQCQPVHDRFMEGCATPSSAASPMAPHAFISLEGATRKERDVSRGQATDSARSTRSQSG